MLGTALARAWVAGLAGDTVVGNTVVSFGVDVLDGSLVSSVAATEADGVEEKDPTGPD